MDLVIENLDAMTTEEALCFLTTFDASLRDDDGAVAKSHLTAGHPIYYAEHDTPEGMCVKEYPSGRKELITFDFGMGKEVLISVIQA
ncbi:hypothetical protein RBI13_19395 [Alcaligenaceae bacterium A4P071]|nr:hypothetical protein [Alcaligenaceae bacterium B3P038]MDQ2151658.1 hypothetical protein [Alcaligenaceae bacterium C4P045]MDQ2187350.1 hypothetical protein [Alcaligenaceae bacterium A4P071]